MIPAPNTSDKHLANDTKGVSILARSLFRDMREQGYSKEQIIGLSAQLIELVHDDLCRGAGSEFAAE